MPMKTLPVPARLYVAATVTVGTIWLLTFSGLPSIDRLPEFITLGLVACLTAVFRLQIPAAKNRAILPSSFVVNFTSLLLFGAAPTLLIAALGELTRSLVGTQRSVVRALFKIACVVITVRATSLSYAVFGGSTGDPALLLASRAFPAAFLTYFVTSSVLAALDVTFSTGQMLARIWWRNFLWSGPTYFVGASVAAVLAAAVDHRLWGVIALGAVPAVLAYLTYGVFVGGDASAGRSQSRESLDEGMAVVSREGRVILWDEALESMLGCPPADALGRPLLEAVPTLADTMVPQVIATVFATAEASVPEYFTLQLASGRRILRFRVLPFESDVSVLWNDVTDRAEAEEALTRSEDRFNSAFVTIGYLSAPGSNDGLWEWDLARNQLSFSARWKSMLGLPVNNVMGRPEDWFKRVHPEDLAALHAALEAHVVGETAHFQHEHRVRHEDGTYRWMLCRGVAVCRADGRATRISGAQTDVTERVSAQEQLRHAALHDTLTALPNRALFIELLGQVLDRRKRHPEQRFAVLFLDIDRFKVVNDSLGHLVGDELLVGISRRLESSLRDGDVLARLGGDEFTILLTDLANPNEACLIAERIREVLRAPFFLGDRELFTTASIGIALSTADYTQPEDIMRDADTAMYRAKALGKARHELFDTGMHAKAVDRLGFEHDLRGAMERREFALHYQPLVSLSSGQWTGFEALLRWNRGGHPVAPSEFIPVAEETGIIEPLGTWVLQEACRQAAVWRRQFPGGVFDGITVNVSTQQLARRDFLQVVQGALKAAMLDPGDLRLEITETVLMDDPERAEVVLRDLRQLGVKIYLDDFGTGYSSLSYLHRFPVDTLKIDRSFVASLKEGSERPAIIESIVTLARTLGTHVIAEGVETERQMHELTRLGCTEAQGYFFGRPLPACSTESLLADGRWLERPLALPPAPESDAPQAA
ncbi:MAG: diguanylate cyclase [Acidobacteria bacterium]|nr:MAG: diguanylate cyclase [Acidobacteriota bacterium]